jgi:hypothetical protein
MKKIIMYGFLAFALFGKSVGKTTSKEYSPEPGLKISEAINRSVPEAQRLSDLANADIPPIVNAGPDQTQVVTADSLVISGSGTDPDGSIASFVWTKVSGPGITFMNETTPVLMIYGFSTGVYVFRLTATDNQGASSYDDVSVTITPTIQVAVTSTLAANAGADITQTLLANNIVIKGSAENVTDSILSYRWTKVSGPGITFMNETTPVLTIYGFSQGIYVFKLTITDDKGNEASDEVTVTINAAPNPPLANAGPDVNLTLPVNTVSLSGTGTDAGGTIVSYSWTQLTGPAAAILTDTAAPEVSLSGLLDGTYTFRLTVVNNSGQTAFDDVTVIEKNPPCNFGTPLSNPLPGTGGLNYSKAFVIGGKGPDLSNVTNINFQWSLQQKALYDFSFVTNNGAPQWYINLLNVSTNTFSDSKPSVTLANTGFSGLDGTYYVGLDNGNLVFSEISGKYTIYFTKSPAPPACSSARLSSADLSAQSVLSPNPAVDYTDITSGSSLKTSTIYLVNESGYIFNVPVSVEDFSARLDISGLAQGIYQVVVKSDQEVMVKKLAVLK